MIKPDDNIRLTRDIMLTRSDWTQLPDAGLSEKCVLEWRKWRQELRGVNIESESARLPTIALLNKLAESHPKTVYDDPDLKVIDANILGSPPPVEPVGVPILDTITDIKVARKYAQKQLEDVYKRKIGAKSPPPELHTLYTERLNQAVDFLSHAGTSFPLLEILAEGLDKPIKEVAISILNTHRTTINNYMVIEQSYIDALKYIKESSIIADIKQTLEDFDGY